MTTLNDSFGRSFSYLRLSITDICNFRCTYCLPNGYCKQKNQEHTLSPDEIYNLVKAFSELGFWKIRLTGGEPTTRKDLIEIINKISAIKKIKKIALSTNAFNLKDTAETLRLSGISALNISIDSLNQKRFEEISGQNKLNDVIKGVEKALTLGFDSIKINTVMLNGINTDEINDFISWSKNHPISVRFIELMQTGENNSLFKTRHISSSYLRDKLLKNSWTPQARTSGDGPAEVFSHPSYLGSVGIIAPYSKDFCTTCNRLRISSRGEIKLCLFGADSYSLRPLLQNANQTEVLKRKIRSLLTNKESSHSLHNNNPGITQNLATIGG